MEQDPPVPESAVAEQRALLQQRADSGSSWFFWIAALSLISSVMHFAGVDFGFLAGLGLTTLIDATVQKSDTLARTIALIADCAVAGVWVGIGLLARRHQAGFIVGLIFYVLDTLFFLLVQQWMSVAFHAWVLFSIVSGLRASIALRKLP